MSDEFDRDDRADSQDEGQRQDEDEGQSRSQDPLSSREAAKAEADRLRDELRAAQDEVRAAQEAVREARARQFEFEQQRARAFPPPTQAAMYQQYLKSEAARRRQRAGLGRAFGG